MHTASTPSSRRILVIEDNDLSMRLTCRILQRHDHEVVPARDATSGLALAQTAGIDLILTDRRLPDLDGLEAVRRLRRDRRTSKIPVVMLTGDTSDEDQAEASEAGCDDFLAKPVDPNRLLSTVARLLEIRREMGDL